MHIGFDVWSLHVYIDDEVIMLMNMMEIMLITIFVYSMILFRIQIHSFILCSSYFRLSVESAT